MARYVLQKNKAALLRPVYRKTDEDYYIYYSGKLYSCFVFSISQSVIFNIAVAGYWTLGPDYRDPSGWIRSEKIGLKKIPTSNFLYVDDGKFVGGDDTLKFIYNY